MFGNLTKEVAIKSMTSPSQPTASLIEVFSAIQGEGLNVGTRQIFIRFALCDLRCHFCDSSHTWHLPQTCQIEHTPGKRDFHTYQNPVTLEQLLEWVKQQNLPGLHDSISITGGEPLLHAAFLQSFLPQFKQLSDYLPVYLETGGHRPQQLSMVLPYLDLVGMDIKLPSVSGESKWQAHHLFLQKCISSSVKVFVKLIVSEQTQLQEIERAAKLIADLSWTTPVFLQPVTLIEPPLTPQAILPPSPQQVLSWQELMKQWLNEVRVIPQTHKMINQL